MVLQVSVLELKQADNFEVDVAHYTRFGKEFLKKQRIHPDTFVQLGLQLAYATEMNKYVFRMSMLNFDKSHAHIDANKLIS